MAACEDKYIGHYEKVAAVSRGLLIVVRLSLGCFAGTLWTNFERLRRLLADPGNSLNSRGSNC